MRRFEVHGAFGLGNLRCVEAERLPCPPKHVGINLRAAALNYRDLLMVTGKYNPRQKLPLVPLSDGVGEVVEVGEGVTRVKLGDRVAGCFFPHWASGPPERDVIRATLGGPLDGMLRDFAVLPEAGVVPVPTHLTDEEAATLPCAGVTAWNAVVTEGGVLPGQTVLLLGTGGVSIFALQIAKLLGAQVIITSSSDQKLAEARSLGADHCINYRSQPDWGRAAKALTGGRGVDLVVEVGGAETFSQSVRSVRVGGRIVLVGILSGAKAPIQLTPIFMRNIRVQGILVGSRDQFEDLNRAIAAHRVRPIVNRVFPFDEAVQAFRYLESGAQLGKVCIRM